MRRLPYNDYLNPYALKLRQQGILAEVLLWKQLKAKALGVKFRKQAPVLQYIVDFYCPALQLVIEIDGATHLEEAVALKDKQRQETLEAAGIAFLRYADGAIRFRLGSVLEGIEEAIRVLALAKGVALEKPEFKGD